MRMRKKTNLVPRMEACAEYWIQNPEEYKGRWRELMPACKELRVEVGCGKGGFTVKTASATAAWRCMAPMTAMCSTFLPGRCKAPLQNKPT